VDPVETVRRDWDTYKSRPAAFLALAVLCLLGGYVAARWVYEAEIRHLTVQVEELKAKRAVPSAIAPQKNAAERRAVEQKVDQVLVAIAKARSDSGKSRTTDRDRAGGRLQSTRWRVARRAAPATSLAGVTILAIVWAARALSRY